LEALAVAFGAGGVGAVAGEEDADVHFVGFGFEPAEVAFHTVPGARPFVLFVFAVVRLAFDDEGLPFLRELFEGDVGGDFELTAHAEEVALAIGPLPCLPRADDTLGKSFGAIGNGKVVINADDAAKSTAGGTCADRMIEAEECGGGLAVFEVAGGAVEAVAESKLRVCDGWIRVDRELPFAEVVGLFAGFDKAGAVGVVGCQAVLDDGEGGEA